MQEPDELNYNNSSVTYTDFGQKAPPRRMSTHDARKKAATLVTVTEVNGCEYEAAYNEFSEIAGTIPAALRKLATAMCQGRKEDAA